MTPVSAPPQDRRRVLVLVLVAVLSFLVLSSYSAKQHAQSSPSASKLAHYLPSYSRPPSRRPSSSSSSSSSSHGGIPHDDSDPDPLAYRRFLEQTTSPSGPDLTTHSPTLGFDHIYVLSLPSRKDRRRDMQKLADALGVEVEFVDAADKREPFIRWIAEQVYESREERRRVMGHVQHVDPSTIGGLGTSSPYLTPFPSPNSTARFPPFPSNPLFREAPNWVAHLENLYSRHNGAHTSLRPEDPKVNVTELLWDPLERQAVRQVHEGVISTFWGQTRAMRRVLENGDRTALILEDDVDVEWDVERLWKSVRRRLPKTKAGEEDWDVAMLGHCWGGESQKPQYLHPLLHPSTGPMCLHGYALTSSGAETLLSHLLSPWTAFSTAVDLMVSALLKLQSAPNYPADAPPLLRSWSITPPLVVQRKDGPSDLQKGNGSKWRGLLRDSTMERVQKDQGRWHEGWEEDPALVGTDPATVLRCGPV
ncbi:hypothetical protein JCM8097_000068 [Rhodosporidiobolus ruineniae]